MELFRPLGWRVDALASPRKATIEGIPDEIRRIRYPFRMLRYWFALELLREEAETRGSSPLQVGEIGIDQGQMLAFSRAALTPESQRRPWSTWNGIDCCPPTERLQNVGYDRLIQLELEDRAAMARQPHEAYDVVILLHVLEHLFDPLAALTDVAKWVKPGGLIIGGSPGTPELARDLWQRRIRRTARPRGHVSVISPHLLRHWSKALDVDTELLNGAFFMRRKGFALENQAWWLRTNLAFGALFPSWPGELYWSWRKPT
ncbi:MAG: methyltransferase domain-containing protein [Caldimonas sp.]